MRDLTRHAGNYPKVCRQDHLMTINSLTWRIYNHYVPQQKKYHMIAKVASSVWTSTISEESAWRRRVATVIRSEITMVYPKVTTMNSNLAEHFMTSGKYLVRSHILSQAHSLMEGNEELSDSRIFDVDLWGVQFSRWAAVAGSLTPGKLREGLWKMYPLGLGGADMAHNKKNGDVRWKLKNPFGGEWWDK